ncbi:hypothetical protein OAU36_01360 [Gammaproteobacteria bacterium]|jgi:hypothetical protein|nr:hypothetical protein [Pseudomonadales bacterium]MDC3196366.1 hypothetical protein [Gammaproteobacteria bacterium]HAS49801.1 hypothetical protein [Gammaproteobacteria bacterium]
MKFKRTKMNAIASGVALGLAAMSVQGADQPILTTGGSESSAVFSGGATINGGASFLSAVPADSAVDFLVTIKPAAADVGKTGNLVVILNVPGLGFFIQNSSGSFVPWTQADPIVAASTKTLAASEPLSLFTGLVGSAIGAMGYEVQAYVGYYTDTIANLTYSSTPASFSIAATAPSTCPTNTTAISGTFKGKSVCVLRGRIEDDTHLTSNFSYILDGAVFIGADEVSGSKTKLTIDEGTYVFGQQGLNFLTIARNGQLHANGSAAKPVIFTYEGDDTATATTSGQWGGIILNGNAPLNVSGGSAEGEGSTGIYGGPDSADSSGVLTYVQVKYAGQNITESNELNGIAFQGTGSGTIVDYVQVHNNSDDGIEFFGGTTNAKHIVLTGNEDDALDWTFGWSGKAQFVAIKQNTASEHCIEADNNGDDNDALPRSNPTISNLTCAGASGGGDAGFRLREGTSAKISNVVMSAHTAYCLDIDQTATFLNAGGSIAGLNGNLTLTNSRLVSGCPFSASDGDNFSVADFFNAQSGSSLGEVDLTGTIGWMNGPILNAITPSIPADSFFDQVDYIGAVKDSSSDWTAGWTYSD